MDIIKYKLMLADDDPDDCMFFREVVEGIMNVSLQHIVNDGIYLMKMLRIHADNLPDILFLDLNMPRKTGYECLREIKCNDILKHMHVVIFSTSLDREILSSLYDIGAYFYIRKPGDFAKLREIVQRAISLITDHNGQRPARENFLLEPLS